MASSLMSRMNCCVHLSTEHVPTGEMLTLIATANHSVCPCLCCCRGCPSSQAGSKVNVHPLPPNCQALPASCQARISLHEQPLSCMMPCQRSLPVRCLNRSNVVAWWCTSLAILTHLLPCPRSAQPIINHQSQGVCRRRASCSGTSCDRACLLHPSPLHITRPAATQPLERSWCRPDHAAFVLRSMTR